MEVEHERSPETAEIVKQGQRLKQKFDYLFRTAEAVYLKCAGKFDATCIAKGKDSEYLLNFFCPD